MQQQCHYQQLIDLFDSYFAEEFNTRLVKDDSELIYPPVDDNTPYHRIVFAHGFFVSTLHEISHWCVAGKVRHEQVDFGYWYCPGDRDAMAQNRSEKVEVKPQAYKWLFCVTARFPFNVSCGNLEGDIEPDRIALQRRVHARVMTLPEQGAPRRPVCFIRVL